MIKYVLKENKNKKSLAFGKWYAFPVADETIDLSDLAKHMEEHNTGFSEAMCLGMMTAMVKCVKEQLLAGKNVKIDNLAIFSVGIRNKEGAKTEAEFTVAGNISGLKLRARATGTLSNANLYKPGQCAQGECHRRQHLYWRQQAFGWWQHSFYWRQHSFGR